MTEEQLQAIKEEYSNMNWEDFRENAGDLMQREIDIYDSVVIDGVPALIAEVERLRKALDTSDKHLMTAERHLRDFKKFEFEERTEKERLREALEEYAASENYERLANEPDICEAGYSHPTWEPSWIELDNGETARKALAGESK